MPANMDTPRGQIVDAISIRERPAEAEDRAVPGHWEGDLLAGAKNSYVATLVERQSRFVMLIKVRSKDTAVVVAALSKRVRKLPPTLRRSLTWDRGLEMAKHKAFRVATDVQVYFCDPQSPWQRGTNENTDLLLRQYFPRGTDLAPITQAQLDLVELRLNQRPRKTLGFQTPASKLQESVATSTYMRGQSKDGATSEASRTVKSCRRPFLTGSQLFLQLHQFLRITRRGQYLQPRRGIAPF